MYAPEKNLPHTPLYSIEYPGYVQESSVPRAIETLGGQHKVDHAFRKLNPKTEAFLELSLRPDNPFAHPIPANLVGANNLVLKVRKRKRKTPSQSMSTDESVGEYTAEVIGITGKVARFRSMADFQYLPDMNDPVSKLRVSMRDMDVDALCSYSISDKDNESAPVAEENIHLDPQLLQASETQPLSLEPTDRLRLFPPPLFSRQAIPQGYNFKQNTASMLSSVTDEETGEEKRRMINRMRWKGYGPASIMFADARVPDKPLPNVEAGKSQVNERLLTRLQELFTQRPIWTRMALFNQLSTAEIRDVVNCKLTLPLCCYFFQDGPWRDTLVRFSYDPRKEPEARFYQRLYFRNANHPISRVSVTARRQERTDTNRKQPDGVERKDSHIFDGKTLSKETAAFQLCDITDPMLKEMIEDSSTLREVCNDRDGWYTADALDKIKTVLRHKFFSLLEGYPATDAECSALLTSEGSPKTAITQRAQKLRAGKHNMAKGALRPEDAAALRLRAALGKNAKASKS